MHEFSPSVNKVNKAVAKIRAIGDRLPVRQLRHWLSEIQIRTFHFLKRSLDRASNSSKFVKKNKSMTPVLGVHNASCGKKLLWISEHFSEC